MKIGIFGGTFNPPHMGHISAARAASRALRLDILFFIPTNIPPHKALPEGSASPAQRMEMAVLAAGMVPGAQALGIELEREGPSYTCDTVRELAERYPGAQLWLIIGTDMLLSFERWREPEEILRYARLAAVCRSERDKRIVCEKASELEKSLGAHVDIIDNLPFDVSSTQLRQGEMADALPDTLARYIAQHGLYGHSELERLREAARARLTPRRLEHTLGCESAAAELAGIHSVNVLDARRAALLHDITKELPLEEQLQICQNFGIITDYQPEVQVALVHADTAAEVARREFGMPNHICDAIKYHSTGRAAMSALEKVIYVADKIEPTRTYGDVPPIRETARRDLDAAVGKVLCSCIAALKRRGIEPHRRTHEALDFINNRVKPD